MPIGIKWYMQEKFYWLELHIFDSIEDYNTPTKLVPIDEHLKKTDNKAFNL